MTQDPSSQNPYHASATGAPGEAKQAKVESADLTTVDWLLCIFCSGIACIIGIVRLIQGKPSAGKMILFAFVFSFLWGIVRVAITTALQNQ